jgi:uncharacterized membrane protein YccC
VGDRRDGFLFRPTHAETLTAGISRLSATGVSFALCLAYLLVLPFHPVGLAALLGQGTLIMLALGRREDVVTTGITTAVVMVVAGMGPQQQAWHQPLLRVIDTVVGITVGVTCKWIASWRCRSQWCGSSVTCAGRSEAFPWCGQRSRHNPPTMKPSACQA